MKFSPQDWKHNKKGCEAIIAEIKRQVASAERDFNPLTNEWSLPKARRELLENLRDQYLVDHNQQSLF